MFESLINISLLSMIVASISFFISHSQLLKRQRKWLWKKYDNIAELVECCYCFGHWVAIVVLLIFPIRLFAIAWPADYLLTWLVISWMAGAQSLAMSKLWKE